VPKLKIADGSEAPVVAAGDVGEGEGPGPPVHDVTVNARRTAPVLITVRRDVLLGTL
jgi:hypothetical protein